MRQFLQGIPNAALFLPVGLFLQGIRGLLGLFQKEGEQTADTVLFLLFPYVSRSPTCASASIGHQYQSVAHGQNLYGLFDRDLS